MITEIRKESIRERGQERGREYKREEKREEKREGESKRKIEMITEIEKERDRERERGLLFAGLTRSRHHFPKPSISFGRLNAQPVCSSVQF